MIQRKIPFNSLHDLSDSTQCVMKKKTEKKEKNGDYEKK